MQTDKITVHCDGIDGEGSKCGRILTTHVAFKFANHYCDRHTVARNEHREVTG